jgi:hypothetical protein
MTTTRPQHSSKYEGFHCPVRAIAAACLTVAIIDYFSFGLKRHHQRCRTGRDWRLIRPRQRADFVPPIYRDLEDKVSWLYSWQFGLMTEKLNIDLGRAQAFYLRLLAGPPVDNDGIVH